ncbi:peptide-methionine (S)-S-oxide reductase [Candidatus Heimdallarchaeota archaeon]|nr:MAG: peptide-methionine (S)-S-oxide reductase [Candidatus Heimdallarchaeota archaeon]
MSDKELEIITLGGGCFWCIEAVFSELKGVLSAVSGYSGGETDNPTYEEVCTGRTGHAEVVQITFDPRIIAFKEILDVFFSAHDASTLNRQGNDVGTQYRSIILYHSENQKETVQNYITNLNNTSYKSAPVVTELKPFERFYEAEKYHQNYFKLNASKAYCKVVIKPKVDKTRVLFLDKLK